MSGNVMNIAALAPALLGGLTGWLVYRYPVQILDFIFGKDPGQWRPMRFFKIFGLAVICLAALFAMALLTTTVLRALG